MKFLLLACTLVLILCATWCCTGPRSGSPVAAEKPPPRPDLDAHALDFLTHDSARATAGTPAPAQAARGLLADDDLIARLRQTAQAWLDHDARALETNLESLLYAPATPRRVLALVRERQLALDSLEFQGAVLVIGFGAGAEVRRPSLASDGKPFTREFLETLSEIDTEPAEPIAHFTASLVIEGRPVVGARWLPLIAVLRDGTPQHASNFDPLVHAILASSEEVRAAGEVQAELAGILARSTDPLTIEAALAVLFATDAEGFLAVAEDMHAHSKGTPLVAQAIVNAIARHAPVELAAASLARLASGNPYGAFLRLGERPGALQAVEREYSALVAARANPLGRKMLVSALGAESTPVLLGIAETDPDAGVRHQALLTLTVKPTDAPEVMRTLRARHAARGDALSGMSTRAALSVAENLALNGSPRVHADAVAFLSDIVVDRTESMADRKLAWTKLKARARPEEIAGMEAPR